LHLRLIYERNFDVIFHKLRTASLWPQQRHISKLRLVIHYWNLVVILERIQLVRRVLLLGHLLW
jgi:hypothetical protein